MSSLTPSPDFAAATPTPLSVRLKEGTHEVHEHVEGAASFNRLIVVRMPDAGAPIVANAPQRDVLLAEYREVYRRFMIAAYGFEAGVNEAIRGSAALPLAAATGFSVEANNPVTLIP